MDTCAPAGETGPCFHCGEPLRAGAVSYAVIGGARRSLCCPGCRAVAEAIAGAGLEAWYQRREAHGRAPAANPSGDAAGDLAALDSPAYQRAVARTLADGTREVVLLLDGVTCAACIWLIERRLAALPGVVEAVVNYATLRARVRWRPDLVQLSAIVGALREIGYDARPHDTARRAEDATRADRRALWRLAVAGLGMMQVMMYAVPVYMSGGDMTADVEALMRWASLLLTTPVLAFSATPFFAGAWRDLRARTVGMDVPVALAIAVAFVASVHATVTGRGEVWFDSITMFVFLLLGARWLESRARGHARQALDGLAALLPAFAVRLQSTPQGDVARRVAVADLVVGDRVVVAAGERIPADGRVLNGASVVDESLVTGESLPLARAAGQQVIGGSTNVGSRLEVSVERVGADTVVAGIARLIERCGEEKPRIARIADALAAPFVWAILAVAGAAAAGWALVDPARALPVAVTILVITCPCALSLATPAALAAAIGSLSRMGVLVARGHALETLAHATHFVFDKTGTLTTGQLALVGVLPLAGASRARALALAGALEAHAHHPIARALTRAAGREPGLTPVCVQAVEDVAGEGVEGLVAGVRARIGRPAFVAALSGATLPAELAFVADHVQVVALGDEHGWIALFTLADSVRPQSRALVRAIAASGGRVCLLTGDRLEVARHVARELGIDHVQAGARPEDKVAFVERLQADGAVVAMVGDGVNDAPVLARAQVSVALGGGADLAQVHADVVLVRPGIGALAHCITVGRRAERVIRQNLAWAIAYNLVAVPAAVLDLVSPLAASIGMAASSALVVANAMRASHPDLPRPALAPAPTDGAGVVSATPRPLVQP